MRVMRKDRKHINLNVHGLAGNITVRLPLECGSCSMAIIIILLMFITTLLAGTQLSSKQNTGTMLSGIRTILKGNSNVDNNVKGIYMEEPPQGTALPFIVLSKVEGTPNDSKTTVSELDFIRVSVSCRSAFPYTKSGSIGAYEIGEYVRVALDHYETSPYFIRYQDQQSFSNKITNKPSYEEDMDFEVQYTRT